MINQTENTGFNPDFAVPPGYTLKEVLDDRGMTQKDLSKRTEVTEKHITNIIKGVARISPKFATELEKVLNISARFWLNLEANYQATLNGIKAQRELQSQINQLSRYPYAEIANKGWVNKTIDKIERVSNLLSFFGVTSLNKVRLIQEIAYRKARERKASPEALSAWLRRGELSAQNIETETYDKNNFVKALNEIKSLTANLPQDFGNRVQKLCSDCGVAVVFVPHLKKTYVNGAARWLTPKKALIQLSLRYKFQDIFWFTFFHEAGHILLHSKRKFFIDCDDDDYTKEEEQADKFASDKLIPINEYSEFIGGEEITENRIVSFAERIGISQGIVVGRLQHNGIIDFNKYYRMRRKFEWAQKNSS